MSLSLGRRKQRTSHGSYRRLSRQPYPVRNRVKITKCLKKRPPGLGARHWPARATVLGLGAVGSARLHKESTSRNAHAAGARAVDDGSDCFLQCRRIAWGRSRSVTDVEGRCTPICPLSGNAAGGGWPATDDQRNRRNCQCAVIPNRADQSHFDLCRHFDVPNARTPSPNRSNSLKCAFRAFHCAAL